jgi:hypothetical protein
MGPPEHKFKNVMLLVSPNVIYWFGKLLGLISGLEGPEKPTDSMIDVCIPGLSPVGSFQHRTVN